MTTNEIKIVHHVKGQPGDRWAKCPHCGKAINLPPGPVRGEQYQHRGVNTGAGCGGWIEVAHDAKLENAE